MPKGRLLITGASGFIGDALARQARANGWHVRATTRHALHLPQADETFRVGELGASTDWRAALAGCDAVAHLAGRAHVTQGDSAEAHLITNTDGTRRLAEQAAEAGVKRFLFLSSVKVLGETSPGRPLTDADLPAPEDAYARSKLAAEQALHDIAQASRMQVVSLRPPLVYGPDVKANFLALMRLLAGKWPLPLGALTNRRSLCYVGNLVDAILACLAHPGAAGRAFLVADAETWPLHAVIRHLRQGLDRRAPLLPVPAPLLRAFGSLSGTGSAMRKLTESLEVDASGLRASLDWHPPYTLAQGLDATARGFRERHGR